MAESVATAVVARARRRRPGRRPSSVVVPSAELVVGRDGDVLAVDDRLVRRPWAASRPACVSRTSARLRSREPISPRVPSGAEKSSSGSPVVMHRRGRRRRAGGPPTRGPRTVVASTTLGEVGSARSTVVIVVEHPVRRGAEDHRAPVDEDHLAAGIADPAAAAAGVLEAGRGQQAGSSPETSYASSVAVAQPQQQAAGRPSPRRPRRRRASWTLVPGLVARAAGGLTRSTGPAGPSSARPRRRRPQPVMSRTSTPPPQP